ncbi:MAG: TonB-dependent receptor [Candidatus Kapabacteria bacterium]|nr:TonB-dependent receptor [Candidatus Kapabacteria bacterium]
MFTSRLLLTAALAVAPALALAQPDSSATADSLRIVQGRELEVSSYRIGGHAPVTHSTITSDEIRRWHRGQDPQFLLERTTPSVLAFSESGTGVSNYGSFRLRGIDQTRVNVTIDGVPLNDMIDQGVFFSNIGDLVNGISSIQVQRGVGMSSNGTAAFAGAVNFETPAVQAKRPTVDAQADYGAFDLLRGSATISTGQLGNGVSAMARVTRLTSNGYRRNTGTDATSVLVSGSWIRQSDMIRVLALWGRTENQLGYLPVPKPLAEADPLTNLNDSTDRDDFGQSLVKLTYGRTLAEGVTWETSLYSGQAGGDYFAGFRDSVGTLTQINYPLTNRHDGVISTLQWNDVAPDLDATIGLHGYRFNRRNWETVMPASDAPYYDDRTQKNEVSGFVRADYQSGDLSARVDVQVRHVDLIFSQDPRTGISGALPVHSWLFVNPRLGLTYRAAEATEFYASYGRTSREPTRFDLLGSTQITTSNANVLLVPNTVRPEIVDNIEIGTRWTSGSTRLQANLFGMFMTDEIAPIGPFIEQQFVQLRKNVPSSRRMGLEFEASASPLPDLDLSANATVMSARISRYEPENIGRDTVYSDVVPILTPQLMAALTATYRLQGVSIIANARYVGQSYVDLNNDPGMVLPSFMRLDLQLVYPLSNGAELAVSLNNVTDAFIVTNGGSGSHEGAPAPTYFVQAGRNFMTHLRWKF